MSKKPNHIAVTYEGNVLVDYSKLPSILTIEETEQLISNLQFALDNAKTIRVQKLDKSAKTLKNEREQLIKQLAEVISNKYYEIYCEYLQLPLMKHELLTYRNNVLSSDNVWVKFPRWYDSTALTSEELAKLWLNNHYTAEQVEDDINHLMKIEAELKQSYAEYSETTKLRDLIQKYS